MTKINKFHKAIIHTLWHRLLISDRYRGRACITTRACAEGAPLAAHTAAGGGRLGRPAPTPSPCRPTLSK